MAIQQTIEMANALGIPLDSASTGKAVQCIQSAWSTGARDGQNIATERAAKICQDWIDDHSKADNCTYNDCDMVAAVTDVMNEIRSMKP